MGLTGSAHNAGMGLFFIAEMAKLVGGRLLVSSRGASLALEGDPNFENPHGFARFVPGASYPGTLVAFEMPANEEQSYETMIETIRLRARERTPTRSTQFWLRFEPAPAQPEPYEFMVRLGRLEDVKSASAFAQSELMPRLTTRQPVVLDFDGIEVVTQSYVHALLFGPLRIAWALKVPIHVRRAAPAVRSTLELLQNYALAG